MCQLLRAENTNAAINSPTLNIPMETEKYISPSPNPGRSYMVNYSIQVYSYIANTAEQ